jgi:tetratricopeptide (TPR) repeat protein
MTIFDNIVKAIEAYDVTDAFKLIEEHRAEYEHHPDFITVQAMLCMRVQEYESACDILLEGVKKYPGDVDLLYNLGQAYHTTGDGKRALEYYNRAIEFSNNSQLITEIKHLCEDIKASPELMNQFNNSKDDAISQDSPKALEVRRICDKQPSQSENAICFITCVNDDEQYNKMLGSVNDLLIPDGYEIECLSVRNASSMAGGYNAALTESDSKYKVYLHQDVLILNKRFIFDVLKIFQKDEAVGAIGVVGSRRVPGTCLWWNDFYRLGCLYDKWTGEEVLCDYGPMNADWEIASIVDGLLIATQYDIKWRDDLFDGWHLYDSSQCCEFKLQGYKVVVPNQRNENGEAAPWCRHNSVNPSMDKHNKYRAVFRKEYWEMIDFGIYLELGCGKTKMEDYLGIDRFDLPGVDIVVDLNKGIPLRDNTVSKVYACHSLEHLDDLPFIMSEIYRVCEHGAIVTIFAPYYLQSTNLGNPFHKHVFLETTFRAYTNSRTTLIDAIEYAIPHAPYWGIGESDNSVCDVDFRTLRLDFTYLPSYYLCSDEELCFYRQSRLNVCEMILYNLVVVKGSFSTKDEQDAFKEALIPPVFWYFDQLRTKAIEKAKQNGPA